MPEQLIYTKSNSIFGSVVQRLCRAVKSGYGVVGKTRGMSLATEENLLRIASRGIAPEDLNPGARYFYKPDFCDGTTQHIFGCTRGIKDGAGDYISHFFVLKEEEVQMMWHEGCTLTPAGVLLVLEEDGFRVQSWQGKARWLEDTVPAWVNVESKLQANQQPTWLQYTGSRETAAILQDPRFREACMLALPVGTPTPDMLRLLHEAVCMRSDLGWGTPLYTHGGPEVTDMKCVMLLGNIGSHMQRRAAMVGLPVLEVTPQLASHPAASVPPGNPSIPPMPPPPQRHTTANVIHIERGTWGDDPPPQSGNFFRSSGKFAFCSLLFLVLCVSGYYVWQNFDVVKEGVDSAVRETEKLTKEREQVPAESADVPEQTAPSLSEEDEKLLMGFLAPVMPGGSLPDCLVRLLQNSTTVQLNHGKLGIYPLDNTSEKARCFELDSEGDSAVLSPTEQPGCWTLSLRRVGEDNIEKKYILRLKNNLLHGVTDEEGHSFALLLPIPVEQEHVGAVLLLPKWEIVCSGDFSPNKDFTDSFSPRFLPDFFEFSSHKLRFKPSIVKKAFRGADGAVTCFLGHVSLPTAFARHSFSLTSDTSGALTDIELTPVPAQSDESFVRCRLQGSCKFDFTDALVKAVESQANQPRGARSHGKNQPAGLAGLFEAVSNVIESTGRKRTDAITAYVSLFTDDSFTSFCASELSHMPMPHESGFSKNGNRLRIDTKTMQRLEKFDYPGIRRYLCEWLNNVAKREFSTQAEQFARAQNKSIHLKLIKVQAPAPGELRWTLKVQAE